MIEKFEVINDKLARTKAHLGRKVTADSKNYVVANFNFRTEEWLGQPIWALFTYKDKTYKKLLGIDGLQENECYIPTEVLRTPSFYVSLYAGDRITTNKYKVEVEESGYTEDITNENTTPSTLEQVESMIRQYALLCNEMVEECRAIRAELMELKEGQNGN